MSLELRQKLGLTIFIASILLLCLMFARGVFDLQGAVGNTATVRTHGVDVYWDMACINRCDSIDWGWIEPDSLHNRTVYVKNRGNTPMTISMTTELWDPANMTLYSDFSWNREGVVIEERLALECTFFMEVFGNVTDTMASNTTALIEEFSFTITITGTSNP